MLHFWEALIAGMVTKHTDEENMPATSDSYQLRKETPSKSISYLGMKVQFEQTENDA